MANKEIWVWMDLEMTGLDVRKEQIIEIAAILTDPQGNSIAKMPHSIVIHAAPKLLEEMHEWCQTTFEKNGLKKRVENSQTTLEEAEDEVLKFLSKHTTAGSSPLVGNSVGTDRTFLKHQMPKLFAFLHEEIVDVSSVKLICLSFFPNVNIRKSSRGSKHLAMDDIKDSIKELERYRTKLFRVRHPTKGMTNDVPHPKVYQAVGEAEREPMGFYPRFCAAKWAEIGVDHYKLKLAIFDEFFHTLEGPEVEFYDKPSQDKAASVLTSFLAQRPGWSSLPLAGHRMFDLRPLLAEKLPSVYEALHYRILETSVLQKLLGDAERRLVIERTAAAALDGIVNVVFELRVLIYMLFVTPDLSAGVPLH